jgi:CIC family chloride channel protein
MSTVPAVVPRVRYREGARGFELQIGSIVFSQSTYLLVAAVVVGIGGGFGAIGFRKLIELEGSLAFGAMLPRFASVVPHAIGLVAVLAIGGAVASWITARFAPEARGHGVPEVMAAVALHGGAMRPRIIGIKALASATSIGFGGSCGREGPIVQIGSAIGSVLGRAVRAPAPVVRTLVACGAAAGISATFNAPIGGVFFASEVILGDFAPRSFAVIVVSSVLAAVISRAYLGNRPSFAAAGFQLVSPRELVFYALLGIVCALWAWGFVRLLYAIEDAVEKLKLPSPIIGAIGFGLVGAIAIFFPDVLGVGYDAIQRTLDGHTSAGSATALAFLKPLATSLTLGFGGSGGVFAPSLFGGAMVGNAFGSVVHGAFPSWTAAAPAYALVAMAAAFAAASEAPITAIVIVFEMSGDYTIVLPLMISTVISSLLGRRLLGSTVYEMKLERRGIDWGAVRKPRPLAHVLVRSLMRPPEIVAHAGETVHELAERLHKTDDAFVPAVGTGDAFLGFVSLGDLIARLDTDPDASIDTLVRASPAIFTGEESIEAAIPDMLGAESGILPIVDAAGTLRGIVSRRDVLDAYRSLSPAAA